MNVVLYSVGAGISFLSGLKMTVRRKMQEIENQCCTAYSSPFFIPASALLLLLEPFPFYAHASPLSLLLEASKYQCL
jgi:hypothetical protein